MSERSLKLFINIHHFLEAKCIKKLKHRCGSCQKIVNWIQKISTTLHACLVWKILCKIHIGFLKILLSVEFQLNLKIMQSDICHKLIQEMFKLLENTLDLFDIICWYSCIVIEMNKCPISAGFNIIRNIYRID